MNAIPMLMRCGKYQNDDIRLPVSDVRPAEMEDTQRFAQTDHGVEGYHPLGWNEA